MRTAHVIRRFAFSEWGGMENAVLNTVRALHGKSNPSEIFSTCALSTVKDEVRDMIPIHRLDYRYPFFPLSKEKARIMDRTNGNPVVPGLKKALCGGEFDLIHCYVGGRMGAQVRAAAKQLHIPCVASLPGGYFEVPPAEIRQMVKPVKGTIPYGDILDRLLGRQEKNVLSLAHGFVCVGGHDLEIVKERFPDKPAIHLPGGVNYDEFHGYDGTDFRKRAGIRTDRKLLLCVSRIDYTKNQLVLPEILALLGESWHLVLIGTHDTTWYADKLRAKIRLMNLSDRVTILNGMSPESKLLPAAYHAASAFLLPALGEQSGLVVLEAWSAGVPAIVSPSGDLKTLVRDGENGFFLPAEGAPHEWADLIRKLDEDADLRGRVTAAADAEVREKYSWDVVADQLLDFYSEVRRIFRRR